MLTTTSPNSASMKDGLFENRFLDILFHRNSHNYLWHYHFFFFFFLTAK